MPIHRHFFAVAFAVTALLSGCGGGGGGSSSNPSQPSGDYTPISSTRNTASCSVVPSAESPYYIASYYGCGDHNTGLIGTWMVVADAHITGAALSYTEFNGVMRMTMHITEHNSTQLKVSYCPDEAIPNAAPLQALIPKGSDSFTIRDPMSNADIHFSVVDPHTLQGEHQTSDAASPLQQVTVERSTVHARKLSQQGNLPPGHIDLFYRYDSRQNSANFSEAKCVLQAEGDLRRSSNSGGLSQAQEGTLTSFVLTPRSGNGGNTISISLRELANSEIRYAQVYFGGEDAIYGASDSPEDVIYSQNDRSGIELDAVLFDINDTENEVSFTALFGF